MLVVLLWLLFASVQSNEYTLCDNVCRSNFTFDLEVNQTKRCCFKERSEEKLDQGIPPKPPLSLFVNWYVYESGTGGKIALNITWIDTERTLEKSVGFRYLMKIVRTSSSWPYKILIGMYGQRLSSLQKNEKVQLNFKEFGRSIKEVDPGVSYMVVIHSLPLPIDDRMISWEYTDAIVSIPDCGDRQMSRTLNCLETSTFVFTSGYSHTMTLASAISTGVPNDTLPYMLACVGLAIVTACTVISLIYMCFRCRRFKERKQRHERLFVVLSSRETKEGSLYAQAGDAISRFFMNSGLKVVYTLWSNTKIQNTDTIRWVDEQVKQADHVILMVTPQQLQEDTATCRCDSEEKSLLNPVYDPFHIVEKNIGIGYLEKKSCYVIYFHDANKRAIRERFKVTCYQLPKNLSEFCMKITNKRFDIRVDDLKRNLTDISLKLSSRSVLPKCTKPSNVTVAGSALPDTTKDKGVVDGGSGSVATDNDNCDSGVGLSLHYDCYHEHSQLSTNLEASNFSFLGKSTSLPCLRGSTV